MDNLDRTKRIINEVIRKSFPYLNHHKIIIKENRFIFGARAYYLYFFSVILIGKGSHSITKKSITSHELCHIEIFKRWGFWKATFLSLFQFLSPSIRRRIEREADILAIEKGYGRALYASRRRVLSKANKHWRSVIEKYYLSPKEIKVYMKTFKK